MTQIRTVAASPVRHAACKAAKRMGAATGSMAQVPVPPLLGSHNMPLSTNEKKKNTAVTYNLIIAGLVVTGVIDKDGQILVQEYPLSCCMNHNLSEHELG